MIESYHLPLSKCLQWLALNQSEASSWYLMLVPVVRQLPVLRVSMNRKLEWDTGVLAGVLTLLIALPS